MKISVQSVCLVMVGVVMLTGCASTGPVTPQYVTPSVYQDYDCQGLQKELKRLNTYIQQTQKQQPLVTTSNIGVGVSAGRWGIVPNITFGVGKSNQPSARDVQLARLYGESDALVQMARIKKCDFIKGYKLYGEK